MNPDDYLRSGILEDYILGLLSREDKQKVENVNLANPEIALQLQLLREGLEMYSGHDQIRHRIELRRSIWAAIKKME
ncbi:MAG: hypothetical protein IPO92_22650 [Saprospiraceae bacterium]|nr:hypothetical protein [Saprospiraceae bacterium]